MFQCSGTHPPDPCPDPGAGLQWRRFRRGVGDGAKPLIPAGDHEHLVHASLLIIEIGNSHISVATDIGSDIRTNIRFKREQTDEVLETAEQSWNALPEDRVRSVIAASVVRETLHVVRERMGERLNEPIRVVGEDLHLPITLAVESPKSVGIDRICSAAAAYDRIGRACAVAGFGTAITVDCVNDEGVFMGGAILPGLNLQARSLNEWTDALPRVSVEATQAVFGATTEQAIRNGILYGVIGAIREITERYATELHAWPHLVATGGNAELICSNCEFIDSVVPDLCLRGIALAHRRHFAPIEIE